MPVSLKNDFALKIANPNGTGSASANGLIMQAIFRMGVPVSGKNLFPSNIQGLPTWYEIRVNRDGHTARKPDFDLMVAMNAETYARDIAEVRSGGFVLYDSSWPRGDLLKRPDVTFLGIPLANLCREAFDKPRERILMKNIAYAGALAALLEFDMALVERMLVEKYGKKKAMIESNRAAIRLGSDYAKAHFPCPLPFSLEPMDRTRDCVLMDGNTATALGCLYAGATVAACTPSRRRRALWTRSVFCASATARTPKRARTTSSSCKRKTSSPPLAWSSARGGLARVRSPLPRAPASR